MTLDDYLEEFATDWRLAGKAATTAETYCTYLRQLQEHEGGEITLLAVKKWLETSISPQTARSRARAVRAFGVWASDNDGPDWTWWQRVPLASIAPTPQRTVSEADYERAMDNASSVRDRLVIELLWSTGMRVSEVARTCSDDVDLANRHIVVRKSKTARPRLVPISERGCRLLRRHRRVDPGQPVLGMTSNAIQQLLQRLGAPSPHAWRRGWAVRALRCGISETSVRAAAGWKSGAMVARYTSAVSNELAVEEFAHKSNARIASNATLLP